MTDDSQAQVPDYGAPHINFAQALVQLARDHGVSSFDGSFRLGFDWERGSAWSGNDVRIHWSEGRHGDGSRIGLRVEHHASIPEIAPNGASVPPLTYASEGNFYEVGSRKGKGQAFYDRWRHRAADFPQSREEALEQMDAETRAYIERRFPQ